MEASHFPAVPTFSTVSRWENGHERPSKLARKAIKSALSTAAVAAIATLGVLLLFPALAQSAAPTFVQGMAFSTARFSTVTVPLTHAVAQGDLLVAWVGQYNAPEESQVADNVNGAWTRAPLALAFGDDTGDIALYYRENSQAAPAGLTITLSVSSPATAYWQGAVADYSGVALAGALDQIITKRFPDGSSVDTGPTPPVGAGELVYAAVITSPSAGSVSPGSSQGVRYMSRAQSANGASFEEDITSSVAGAQDGTATLSSVTDWYAVCAVFHPYPATPPVPPSTPTGLEATSAASTRVTLSWSASSTGSVAGYAVYRDGSPIGTTRPDTTVFVDQDVTPSTTSTYTVDAFDLANDHSAPSAPLTVTTPAVSPEFVQGAAASTGSQVSSYSLPLTEPVQAGDLLVGWFSQFGASGQVRVSDNVNGPWTRSVSTTWGGSGDIALYYRQNSAAAPSGLTITVLPPASAYLQEAVAHYRHVATAGALDQAVVADGQGTYASTGPTAPVPADELVVAAALTSGQPVFVTAGSSQMVPYVLDVRYGSASADLEDILSCATGPQQGSLTLGTTDTWHMVLATFRPILTASSTTTLSPTTTTTSTTSTTIAPTTTTSTTTLRSTTTTTSTTSTTTAPTTTTVLSSSASPSVSGQAVTFTATVTAKSPGGGTPTGTVTFKDGLSTLDTGTLNSSSQARFMTSTLAVGSHSIASYGGDALQG